MIGEIKYICDCDGKPAQVRIIAVHSYLAEFTEEGKHKIPIVQAPHELHDTPLKALEAEKELLERQLKVYEDNISDKAKELHQVNQQIVDLIAKGELQ
jgi:hypothetical protein